MRKNNQIKISLTGFPNRFVDNVIHQFNQMLIDKLTECELIISDFLFAEPKKFILAEIPFWISKHRKKIFIQITIFCSPQI